MHSIARQKGEFFCTNGFADTNYIMFVCVSDMSVRFYVFLCGLCRHAVSVCVCLSVTFIHPVKTNKHIFKLFLPSGSHTTLVFPYQASWQYSDGDRLNGGVECRWGRQYLASPRATRRRRTVVSCNTYRW